MPTIEIIVPECKKLISIKNSKLPFYVRQNRTLISDGGLFQNFLNKKKGIILHLGNKELGSRGCFFGSDLIDWNFEKDTCIQLPRFDLDETGADQIKRYKFKKEMFPDIVKIFIKQLHTLQNRFVFFTQIYNSAPKRPAFFQIDY
jgi:hypothetical protein